MLPWHVQVVKLTGSYCNQCKTLSWISEAGIHATEKWYLYYYYSVNRTDYYAIKI